MCGVLADSENDSENDRLVMEKRNDRLDDFFMEYRTMVIRNAYMYVKDYYVAEDICQETFIRFGKHMEDIPSEKVKGWLFCISERLAFDYLRKGGKYETFVGLEETELNRFSENYSDVSHLLEKKEEYEHRGRVLERLKREKPLWYETMCMCYLENMDNPSIGKELGVKPYLISKWKERAKSWLKTAYEEEYK